MADSDSPATEKSTLLSRRRFVRTSAAVFAGSVAGSGASAPAEARLRPEAFGAVGDGVADDTRALRTLFRTASGPEPRTVELTPGKTYLIAAAGADEVILPLARGIGLVGHGATIKLAAGSRGFHAILGSKDSAVDLSGLRIEGVVFDHNAQNERTPPLAPNGVLSMPRCTVKAKRGIRLAFVGNVVLNAVSTNCVEFNGDGNTARTLVSGCRFYLAQPRGGVYFDHSTLYLTGDAIEVTDNQFENASWASPNGTCAIEIHPGHIYQVRRNQVLAYHTGVNIAGIYQTDSREGVVADNHLDTLRRGIAIYSQAYRGHQRGYGIDWLAIDANRIRIRNALRRGRMTGGGPGFFGIGLVGGATLPVRNLRIGDANRIGFDLESAPPDWDSLGAGIWLGETAGRTIFEDIEIGSLEITNSPLFGIAVGSRGGIFRNCRIARPLIVNPGSTARPDAVLGSADYRTGIWISPYAMEGRFRILGARIVDNLETSRMVNAIVMEARAATGADIEIDAEIMVSGLRTSSYRQAIRKFDNRLIPLVHLTQNNGPVSISAGALLRPGSTLTEGSTGRVRTIAGGGVF